MKNSFKQTAAFLAVMFFSMLNATSAMAQAKVDDKEVVGVWIMTSMKWEGENKELISESYNQVKVYRANGEYACAEIIKQKDGKYRILPHEYGTYYLKNGKYSEMGRKEIDWNWVDKETTKGRWHNRIDAWQKVKDFPKSLEQHIVDKCKATAESPKEMQDMMSKFIFKK